MPWRDFSVSAFEFFLYHKKHENVWFMGSDLSSSKIVSLFMKYMRWGMCWHTRGSSQSILLNAWYHKKYE